VGFSIVDFGGVSVGFSGVLDDRVGFKVGEAWGDAVWDCGRDAGVSLLKVVEV
jgi:hypothetical protein